MGDQVEVKYVRLLGSLLTCSDNIAGMIRGYAEIAYYTIKRKFHSESVTWEIQIFQSLQNSVKLLFKESRLFDLWWRALTKICVVKNLDFQLTRVIGKGGFAIVH